MTKTRTLTRTRPTNDLQGLHGQHTGPTTNYSSKKAGMTTESVHCTITGPCLWDLDVPRYNRSTLGRRSFSVAGPTVWNLLPDDLRDQDCTESTFKQSLKTHLFAQH